MIGEILILIGGIVIFCMFITLGWGINRYNFFASWRQNIETQWSNILSEYKRRIDLFVNLAETVKGSAKFEKSTLMEVIAARGVNLNGPKKVQADKMKGLDNVFSKLLAVVEQYPVLKSVDNYSKLVEEIRITEDRINVARTDFNDVVREYNTTVVTFPNSIIAGMFNFNKHPYFMPEEKDIQKTPKIDLAL